MQWSGRIGRWARARHRSFPGQPRSELDQAALARFGTRMRLPLVLAAVVPIFIVPEAGDWVAVLVGVASWAVFVVDFVVSERRRVRYLSTGLGRFDLTVVVLTAPWFLLPGARAGSFVVLLRLAGLARVLMVSRGAKRLLERLGRDAAVALGVVFVGAALAYHAEHATNPEFATFGDALWWGIVNAHDRRLRRHRPQNTCWPLGRGHDHGHRDRRRGVAGRVAGQLLPSRGS